MKSKNPLSLLIATLATVSLTANDGSLISDTHYELLNSYCLNCHDEEEMEGDVNLDRDSIDWSKKEERSLWLDALSMLQEGLMPPEEEKDEDQPSEAERAALIDWLDASLTENTSFGGTLARRLSKAEYQNTIRNRFDLPKYKVPLGFPEDSTRHGFNNTGDGLILSPTLLESYFNIANQVAETLFPVEKASPESSIRVVGPNDMVANYAAAAKYDNALRFASSGTEIMRSCSWPKRMMINSSGVYKITVSASSFLPRSRNLMKEGPMLLELRARDLGVGERARVNRFRLLETISVSSETPMEVSFEAELYEGETILFHWNNSPLSYGGRQNGDFGSHVRKRFENDKRVLAAWQKVILDNSHDAKEGTLFNYGDLRGISGWERFKKAKQDKNLDMSHATMDSAQTEELIALFAHQGNVLGEAFVYDYFEKGPALDLHGFSVEGPLRLVDGPKDKAIKDRQQRLFGVRNRGQTKEKNASDILEKLLPKLFRRPVESHTIDAYLQIATEHWAKGHSYEDGLHLLVRSILMSPRFLYRKLDEGPTNDYDIATRLSYFLTQGPPDKMLVELAAAGKLSDSEILKEQSLRLLPKNAQSPLVQSFTSQWLDTKRLNSIMPDPKFDFTADDIDLAKREVEHFFAAMLKENRPMTDFIDPDFTFTTPRFADRIYKVKNEKNIDDKDSENEFQRITLRRDGRYGGLLGMSAVMTATANGVDTQPVLRGVWLLENILGSPVPEAPPNVPALTPDTQGAETPRDVLAAHTENSSCMKCHKKIDPLGFVLENFDPVGRWRDKWPDSERIIDASATLQDGSTVEDVIGLKRWMVTNIDLFSKCLAVKLMIYATGREPSYIEVKEIEGIVKTNLENNKGFQDLFVDLILSETFRAK
ncbi:MAG: DUF1588 domain-containing protein [Opitutales bacterium]|nr:DUF1588 domain-containing protein [Opitutales bacterium]MBT5169264.1 DUF1588 domain-containing protein [Opitutales bacterium]